MRTRDLNPDKHYATCNGNKIELVEPVHARWAKVESDGNKPHRFVELDEDAVKGKKSDPWGKCHTNKASLGVRCKLWKTEHIDRDGEIRDPEAFTEVVLQPGDIAGTWKDYMTLHGATVRAQADQQTEKELRAEIGDEITDWLRDRLPEINTVAMDEWRSKEKWRFTVVIPHDQAKAIVEAERAKA